MIKNKQGLIKSIENDLKYGFNFKYESNQKVGERYILKEDADLDFDSFQVMKKSGKGDYGTIITANICYHLIFNNENNEKIMIHLVLTKLLRGFWMPLDYEKDLKGGK